MEREDQLQNDLLYFFHSTSHTPTEGYVTHCHAMYEVYFFLEGDVDYRLEGREYHLTPGCMLLIAPYMFHGMHVRSSRAYHRFSVHFMPELLEGEDRRRLTRPFRAGQVFYPQADAYGLVPYYQMLLDCLDMPEEIRDIALKSRFIALLTQVNKMVLRAGNEQVTRNRLMGEVLQYLNGHLRERLSLEDVAGRFYLSRNHLNVLFRKATGTTVHQYVRRKRLALAQHHLLEGMPAAEAAREVGFGDYSSFYRAYRAVYSHPPGGTGAGGDAGNLWAGLVQGDLT